jgi:hypothetical protein
MTVEERNQVLKMIENGKLTADEGLKLIHTLDDAPESEISSVPQVESSLNSTGHAPSQEVISNQTVQKYKGFIDKFWQVVLWTGVVITILGAFGTYLIIQSQGWSPWLILVMIPLVFGIFLLAISVGAHRSHFMIVDVHQKKGGQPEHIFLGFPLPLKLFNWFVRTFKNMIPGLNKVNLEEFTTVLDTSISRGEPMVIDVDDSGNRVKVYMS